MMGNYLYVDEASQLNEWVAGLSATDACNLLGGASPRLTAKSLYRFSRGVLHGQMKPPDKAFYDRIEFFLIEYGCPVLTKELILFGLKEV